MQRRLRSIIGTFGVLAVLACGAVAANAQGQSVSGRVTFGDNGVIHDATVQIVQLKRTVKTDNDGRFEFTNVPPGKYSVTVHNDGFADTTRTIEVGTAPVSLDFVMVVSEVKEEVTITASGAEQTTFEAVASVETIAAGQIMTRSSASLGDVLEGESGVSKRSFGAGSSRPVIRGFDGDRVLVAQDGVRSGSLGSQSGDHAETVDTLNVDRIEVVKGPATLLYGSNAIGGVVNAVSNHDDKADKGFRGFLTAVGATNALQGGLSGGLEYGTRRTMVFGNGSFLNADDYKSRLGVIPNSSSRSFAGTFGAGYYTDKSFVSGTFNLDRRRYGIPFAALIESGGVSNDDNIDITPRSYNFKVNAGFREIKSFITAGKFTVNVTRYKHDEVENETVGTTLTNNTVSYRGSFEQKKVGPLTGRFGFDGFTRDYETVGDERLIEGKVRHDSFAAFGLEEIKYGRVTLQFGGRVERNAYDPKNPALIDRSFTGFSGGAGIRIGLWEKGAFVFNYSNSFRAPALEELYNNGPHVGTVAFEIGNPLLRPERSNGLDFSLRHQGRRFRAEFDFFSYWINNYVFLAYADEDGDGQVDIEDNLPVLQYSQGKSRYTGAEFSFDVDVTKRINAFFSADYVRAQLTDARLDLPRIPPSHAKLGFDYKIGGFNVRPEFSLTGAQKKLYPLETRTAGFGLLNVSSNYVIGRPHLTHIISFNAYNLLNKEYRNHLSFIKDLAPEIGRGFKVSYTIRFF